MPRDPNPIIGDATCALCGAPVQVKANRSGRLYYFCYERGDCSEHRSASDAGDDAMAERITKWHPGMREKFEARTREDDEPADPGTPGPPPPPPPPAPRQARPRPSPPAPKKPTSWWDEII